MNFGWETEEEKLLRAMKVSAKRKMEWLRQMHELLLAATPERKKIFWRLRGIRQ